MNQNNTSNTLNNSNTLNTTDPLIQFRESIKLLSNALNKACKGGTFTLDEAYLIRIATNNMEKLIDMYDKKDQQNTTVQSNTQL